MRKSKYLVLSLFYFKFDTKLSKIIEINELFKNQNILDLFRFDNLKNIKENQFEYYNLNFIYLPQNIEIIKNYAFDNNQIKILDLSNCIKLKNIGNCAFEENPLKKIKILNNIKIIYGDYNKIDDWNNFIKYYDDNGKKSGDYKLENNQWQWYPL